MSDQDKVYLVRAGRNGEDEEYVLENNRAIIGWQDVPSLQRAKDYDDVLKLVSSTYPESKPRVVANYAGQLWLFAIAMPKEGIVVLPRKLTSQVAIGRVAGPYEYIKIGNEYRHSRPVEWLKPEVPRATFGQDLLYSMGAFMTVCTITRNDAAKRISAILAGKPDPGFLGEKSSDSGVTEKEAGSAETGVTDLSELAHDQIVAHIQSKFTGHALARLVSAVLQAEGWVTRISAPGPDGGVDILAGRGSLGLDHPRLCVQVKSQIAPCDVTVYRSLHGSMHTYGADQGLLVCWGGFTRAVQAEARSGYFSVRLWESTDLVKAILRNYEKLPAEIQTELPLKRAWMLVLEEPDE